MQIHSQLKMSQCTYEVGKADNGYIFGFYSAVTDEYRTLVAMSAQELGDFILQWQHERVAEMVKYLTAREIAEKSSRPSAQDQAA